jgi:two-component system, chemotaxis family, sensor kinase Cph1
MNEIATNGNAAVPWNGPYSVKRHGLSISNCDAEPVQTPGCVQAHGVLLALRPATLEIVQASENTEALLGIEATALIGRSVGAVVGELGEVQLRAFVDVEPIDRNPLYVYSMPAADGNKLDVTVHANGGVLLLELEATGRTQATPNPEPDYYGLVRKTVVRLQGAGSLQQFCDTVCDEVRALTGLDRVMVYRFHADGHGEVYAESRRADIAPWLGLHYPAEDIPTPAREIFKRIWLRPTPEVPGALAEMVPLVDPVTRRPLDMTHCVLRGPSVMYTEYLQNMRVTAGLTLSLRQGEMLWGLVACHHYAGPRHVPYPVRAACEFLAQVASLQLRAAEDREHLQYRLQMEEANPRIVATVAQSGDLGEVAEGGPNLLDALRCGGAAIFHADRWSCSGNTPTVEQLDTLADWLYDRPEFDAPSRPVYDTDHLAIAYPPGAAFANVASGVLALPLARAQRSLVIWFRPETMQTIRWAGNPHDKPTVLGPHGPRLTPRASFELFAESVRQRAEPWLPVERDSAVRLRLLLLEIVVERAERVAALNADLERSNEELDAFAYVASHDLKEPLRGIHKYAHQMLEAFNAASAASPVDAGGVTRQRLDGLLRLTVRMDSLLDSLLHFSRVGRLTLDTAACDLNLIVDEAIEMVGSRVEETSMALVRPRPLPTVQGDWMRCREIYVNLLSNALKYNDKPERRITLDHIAPDEDHPRPNAPAEAAGQWILSVADNGIGIAPRHYDQVFKMFRRLHARDAFGGGSGAGLTITKKLVERHGGRIWIDAVPGAGATFYFTLPSSTRQA